MNDTIKAAKALLDKRHEQARTAYAKHHIEASIENELDRDIAYDRVAEAKDALKAARRAEIEAAEAAEAKG